MMIDERMQVFCGNISYLRAKHGLSKAKMAKLLGIGIGTLNRLESGIVPRRLGCSMLIRASDCFNISVDELFYPIEE